MTVIIDLYKGPQLGISWVDAIHDHAKEAACNR